MAVKPFTPDDIARILNSLSTFNLRLSLERLLIMFPEHRFVNSSTLFSVGSDGFVRDNPKGYVLLVAQHYVAAIPRPTTVTFENHIQRVDRILPIVDQRLGPTAHVTIFGLALF